MALATLQDVEHDEVAARFLWLPANLASLLVGKAKAMTELGRPAEAISSLEEAIEMLIAQSSTKQSPPIAGAWSRPA